MTSSPDSDFEDFFLSPVSDFQEHVFGERGEQMTRYRYVVTATIESYVDFDALFGKNAITRGIKKVIESTPEWRGMVDISVKKEIVK